MVKFQYIFRLCRARRCIENSFGILAQKWRIYRKPILADKDKTIQIVKATLCLHNWLRRKEMAKPLSARRYCSASDVDSESRNGFITTGTWRQDTENDSNLTSVSRLSSNFHSASASEMRQIYLEYFTSSVGQVSWQDNVVNRGKN